MRNNASKIFPTSAPINVRLDIPAGRIQFIAADRADSTVEVRPASSSSNQDVAAAERVQVAHQDGVLRIEAAPAGNRLLGSSGSVEVTVQLPAGSRVDAKTASADIRGVGRLGDVTVESAQGTIKLDETISARLTLQAGDITVGRLGGPAEIRTQHGDLTVTEAVTGAVTLRTDKGDITVGAVSGSLDAGTTYGRIDNALRNTGDSDLTLHATTSFGDISARSL
ncbi:DUF4097 family beta strand repeat-containing protein [Actinoplanes sp. G11-F43]|uniref:DUF4097 family beta strand repeat-containing protein n=1 Tax=Actinoplanes sp. G11-F43 TaxID=3424130 RepID=UPI003D34A4EC